MSLKADRRIVHDTFDYFCNDTTASRGSVVSVSTVGSGAGMDQSAMVCTVRGSSSGATPIGILMNDVVNYDLTRQKLNSYKDEVQSGSKVTITMKGELVTDKVAAVTITAGDSAYLSSSGVLTNVNGGAANTPRVGTFMTKRDEDGFARVNVNLP